MAVVGKKLATKILEDMRFSHSLNDTSKAYNILPEDFLEYISEDVLYKEEYLKVLNYINAYRERELEQKSFNNVKPNNAILKTLLESNNKKRFLVDKLADEYAESKTTEELEEELQKLEEEMKKYS